MKKFLTLGLFLFTTYASAQIQKDDWTVGGNFFASTTKLNKGTSRAFNASFGSNVGYFVRDGLRLGLSIQTHLSRSKEEGELRRKSKQISLGPTISYYLLLSKKTYWLNEFGYSTTLTEVSVKWSDEEDFSSSETTSIAVRGSTGIGYFLNNNWSIEATLTTQTGSLAYTRSSNYSDENLGFHTNIGFRYFITNRVRE